MIPMKSEEIMDQLIYEIEDRAAYGFEKPKAITSIDSEKIAEMIINQDKEIIHLFSMDPAIPLIYIDDEDYDWADFYNELESVIEWYTMNPLIKIFGPK